MKKSILLLLFKVIILNIIPYIPLFSQGILPKSNELNQETLNWINTSKNKKPFYIPKSINHKSFITTKANTTRLQISPNSGIINDIDGDGLTLNEELLLHTDPHNPDTDGDALLDGWEVHPTNGVDLHSMGASPLHKDIFVEMDYMERVTASNGLGPNLNVIASIEQNFANIPILNPDNTNGINIHLITGNRIPYDENLFPYLYEFNKIKQANFNSNRAPFFHYMIWANSYNGSSSSGISMNIPHSDFIVTLGKWNKNQGGTDEEKVGTFIHELGHNLGLRHGGSDDMNFKPNHISIMNYYFQTQGIHLRTSNGSHIYKYSFQEFEVPQLSEYSLIEFDGLGKGNSLYGYFTFFRTPDGRILEVLSSGSIDWNTDDIIDKDPLELDINSDGAISHLESTPNECLNLIFNGGSIGKIGSIAGILESAKNSSQILPIKELDEELNNKLKIRR